MEIGTKGKETLTVTAADTARAHGSGMLDVLATPAMVALMEHTAMESVAGFLQEGETTVGTSLRVSHLAATPVGMTVTCESVLVDQDGRRLVFEVTARDACGEIGCGVHERFIVSGDRFQNKADGKLAQ